MGLGWGRICNIDCVTCGPVWGGVGVGWGLQHRTMLRHVCWGWGVVGVATQTVLCVVLSGGVGGGFVMSCQWGWGGVGFAAKTVKCGPVCGVGVGWCLLQRLCCVWSYLGRCWGGVLQHRPCYVLSVGLEWGGVCYKDCVTCGPIWGGGFATQTVLGAVLCVGLGWFGVCNTDRVVLK